MYKKGLPNANNCAVFAGRFEINIVADNQIPANGRKFNAFLARNPDYSKD